MNRENLPIKSDRITPSQSMSLITSSMIGVGVLTLPRTTTETALQQGWIATLLGAMITAGAIWVITVLIGRMAGTPFSEYVSALLSPSGHRRLGKILAFPILISYAGYWFIGTALVARTFGEVVVTAVLPETPLEVLVASMLLLSLYLCYTKEKVVARVNEFLLPLLVVPLLILGILTFQNSNFSRLRPVFPLEMTGIMQAVVQTLFVFTGYEIILQFASQYSPKYHYKWANQMGVGVVGLVFVLITIAGLASFGHEELQRQTWPTLELVKTVNAPGLILERSEAVFLGVWVAAVFTTAANYFYAGSKLITDIFGIRKTFYVSVGIAPLLYITAMYPRNQFDLFAALGRFNLVGSILGILVPLLLLGLSLLRKKRGESP